MQRVERGKNTLRILNTDAVYIILSVLLYIVYYLCCYLRYKGPQNLPVISFYDTKEEAIDLHFPLEFSPGLAHHKEKSILLNKLFLE